MASTMAPAHLLAQGVAWHLGALAYGVIGQYAGSPTTCIGGHGIYDVRQPPNTGASYLPGDFIHNPADGSDPASYALGADGSAVQAYLAQQQAEDLADIGAILWPWSETDSTRAYSEKVFFQDGAQNSVGAVAHDAWPRCIKPAADMVERDAVLD